MTRIKYGLRCEDCEYLVRNHTKEEYDVLGICAKRGKQIIVDDKECRVGKRRVAVDG